MKSKSLTDVQRYNACVHNAYFDVLRKAKAMLSTIEQSELRCFLERSAEPQGAGLIHEFISPLLFLRLGKDETGHVMIHWGFEECDQRHELNLITQSFVRYLYKATAQGSTPIDIEKCVKTDWMHSECSNLFEHILERNRYHQFKRIRYRAANQSKQAKVPALV